MTSTHKIVVKNLSNSLMNFFVYQQPAKIVSAGTSYKVFYTSLGTGALLPHASSGAELSFEFKQQVLAAAYSNDTAANITKIGFLTAQSAQSDLNASWPIELTPSSGTAEIANNTVLSLAPLGLSKPKYAERVPKGNFGITVPSYMPQDGIDLFCGVAIDDPKEGLILSSYVTPAPASQVFCAPEAKYYIEVGTYAAGYILNFPDKNAALCDFTNGASICNVSYDADGSFEVTKS